MIPKKESQTVEFKTSFNEEVTESLVAFSNTKGGTLYAGITDNGKITGVTIGKETIPDLLNKIKLTTSPQIVPDVEIIEYKNKTILALSISEYPIKPVSVRGKYFKRVGNSNHLLTTDEISNEYLRARNTSWDYYIDPDHSEDALSKTKISKFIL